MARRAKCANCYVCDKAKCPMDRQQTSAQNRTNAKQNGRPVVPEEGQTERGGPTCGHGDEREGEK